MNQQGGVPPDQRKLERAIIFQLLRDDHDARWSRTELAGELDGVEAPELAAALKRLCDHGVLLSEPDTILASPSVGLLDALGVIGI